MKEHVIRSLQLVLAASLLITRTLADQAQFYQKSENFGVAISSTQDEGNVDFRMQISAPTSYGWASVGTGDKMDKSLMFVIYPSGVDDDVVLSIRTADGHDTPLAVSGVNATLVDSTLQSGRMSATLAWHQDSKQTYRNIDITNSKQAWIWAVGPTDEGVEDASSPNAVIEQHSHYGVFFVNMPFTTSAQETFPTIVGTSSIHAKGQPSYYHGLVYAHAVLLGIAFVIAFPTGVIALRSKFLIAFKLHWLIQAIATAASYIGLAIAIALSVVGIQYSDIDQGHQILGIVVIGFLSLQVLFGYVHHQKYKKIGRRTVSSFVHIGLGRAIIYAGMINAILGALLSDDTAIAAAVGGVSALFAAGLEYMAFRRHRRSKNMGDIPLKTTSNEVSNSPER